jgi:hypothetical protein
MGLGRRPLIDDRDIAVDIDGAVLPQHYGYRLRDLAKLA